MLKIWSDDKYLRRERDTRPILMPFFNPDLVEDGPQSGRFDHWIANGKSVVQLVSLENADVVVYPQDPTIDPAGLAEFQKVTSPKPMFVFFNSDSDAKISLRKGGVLFRTSGNRSSKFAYERGLPAWSPDYGQFPLRNWVQHPTVGFCGQDRRPALRSQVLNKLAMSSLNVNFIRKNTFWGGWIDQGKRAEHGFHLREEFKKNMNDSDYNVCVRGGGNFSFRLYETLSAGRIPILIDTDCILPSCFSKADGLFPIIKERDLPQIAKAVYDFHNSHKHDFQDLQNNVRKFWETYLSPFGFFSHISEELERQ